MAELVTPYNCMVDVGSNPVLTAKIKTMNNRQIVLIG
jgi:hypothetical protein